MFYRRRRVKGALAASLIASSVVLGALVSSAPAVAAPGAVVLDLDADPVLREEAVAVSLLLGAMLAPGERALLGRIHVSAALAGTAGQRDARQAFAEISGAQAAAMMVKLAADRLFTGSLSSAGGAWRVSGQVIGPDGKVEAKFVAVSPGGETLEFARHIARRLAVRLGLTVREIPAVPLYAVRPYARAAAAMDIGDVVQAGRELDLADPKVTRQLSTAYEVAGMVASAQRLPEDARVRATLTAGDPQRALQLADTELAKNPGNVELRAGKAQALIQLNRPAEAQQEIERASFDKRNPGVVVAKTMLAVQQRAQRTGSGSAGEPEVAQYLEGPSPPGDKERVLAFVSAQPPNALSPELEQSAVKGAASVAQRSPAVASRVGMRALSSGVDPNRSVAMIKGNDLARQELSTLQANASALGPNGAKAAHKLGQILEQRQTEAQEVRRDGLNIDVADGPMGVLSALLRPLLAQFPEVEGKQFGRVLVLRHPDSGQPLMWPLRVRPFRLAHGLMHTMWRPPYELGLAPPSPGGDAPSHAFITPERLADIADAVGADGVVLFRLRPEGLDAGVALTIFDVATRTLYSRDTELPGFKTGLLAPNPTPIIILAGATLVLAILYVFLWRTGQLLVQIDSSGTNTPTLCITVTRFPTAPEVGDPTDFVTRIKRDSRTWHNWMKTATAAMATSGGAVKQKGRNAMLVSRDTLFGAIRSGKWYVHVYGIYSIDEKLHATKGDRFTQRVEIKKGKLTEASFSLLGKMPATAIMSVSIVDGRTPVRDALVWLDDKRGEAARTGSDGQVVLYAAKGRRVIHVEVGGHRFRKPREVQGLKQQEVVINLAWERRALESSHGPEKGEAPVAAAAATAMAAAVVTEAAPPVVDKSTPIDLPPDELPPDDPIYAATAPVEPEPEVMIGGMDLPVAEPEAPGEGAGEGEGEGEGEGGGNPPGSPSWGPPRDDGISLGDLPPIDLDDSVQAKN